MRAFTGALSREKLTPAQGIFVTLSDYTDQARAEAKASGVALVDKIDLYARVEKVRRAEPCRECGKPMRLDRSRYGWWLRCVTPGCSGKKHLSNDPGRALELLIEPPTEDPRSAQVHQRT